PKVALNDRKEEREERRQEDRDARRIRVELRPNVDQHAPRRPPRRGAVQRKPDRQREDGGNERERNQQERQRRRIQIGERRGEEIGTAAVQQRARRQQIAREIDPARPPRAAQRLNKQEDSDQGDPRPRRHRPHTCRVTDYQDQLLRATHFGDLANG